ncbi:MAG: stage V sporulation protein AD [Clostridia bacterium]|nr:stage V sporulation protein AD [Clostridia bacterium]
MPKRTGRYTIEIENNVTIHSSAGIVGKKESEGPLGKFFDKTYQDNKLGQSSWEKAESTLQQSAVSIALNKISLSPQNVDMILAGDLLNQCISSTFGLRALDIPFLAQYGACSTMAQTLALGSILVDSGAANNCIAVTSSHFCSAERQFRFPIEYGGQRTPTAQWTVTGAGAAVIDKSGIGCSVRAVTVGKINDLGIKDANNMGAAMAPAAADTIRNFFKDTNFRPDDFDLILTGDLGKVGSVLLLELLEKDGIKLGKKHNDCGLMIYDIDGQDVHSGGSGCGCSGSVFCSYIMQKLNSGELNNILFVATGALMSPTSSQQGESIPGIAHLLHICSGVPQKSNHIGKL